MVFLGFAAFEISRPPANVVEPKTVVPPVQPEPPKKIAPKKQPAQKQKSAPKPAAKPKPAPQSYPLTFESGKVRLILTDFTKVLKPDNGCGAQVCREFVSLVDNAKQTIDMAVFGWDDVPAVTDAIKNATERGVKIRLVYDEQPYYPGTAHLAALIENRVSARAPGKLMHNKFAIFDGQKVFTGSMNFTATGFSGFNANSVVVINCTDTAVRFTSEFERLYTGAAAQSGAGVYFSPNDTIVAGHLVPLIDSAREYVYVPAFIVTHEGFAQSLIRAKARGVDVKVIIDAVNPLGPGSKTEALRQAGVEVKAENYAGKMHSKSVIIDDRFIGVGSMNFSYSGERINDENVVILEDAALAGFYRGYFEYLWAKIPDRYLKTNPRAESKWSIGSCEDGVDNDFDGKIDADDTGCAP